MNHTPTPWAQDGTVVEQQGNMIGDGIGRCFGAQARANAAHIVKCVNLHDELVAALEAALSMVELHTGNGAQTQCGAAFDWDHEQVASAGRAVLAKVQ